MNPIQTILLVLVLALVVAVFWVVGVWVVDLFTSWRETER